MTLQEIAKLAGKTTHRCGEEWGGTWGYGSEKGANINGFKTEEEAISHAVLSLFEGNGELGKLCLKLLKKLENETRNEKRYVSRDMAHDAGFPEMEGMRI